MFDQQRDPRKYPVGLVKAMRARERTVVEDGLTVLLKPIPDEAREHVLDPRVKATAERKRTMFAQRARKTGGVYSLAGERFRPDKVTYDLNTEEVDVEERLIDVGGNHKIDVFSYRAEKAPDGSPILVFLHGGGFTAGNERIYHNQMRFIAQLSGATVVFPEYRLAPESPFPAAIEDCVATVRWAYDNAAFLGSSSDKIMIAGDSAGGSLSIACVLEDAGHLIKRSYLLFPSCDMSDYRKQKLYTWSYDKYPIVKEQRELAHSRMDRIRCSCTINSEDSTYVQGKTSLEDPLVSVVFATDEQLGAFPPTTIAVSEYDYLRIGAEYFAHRLGTLRKDVRLVRYCGCDHGFLDLFGTEPQAEEVCMDISDQVALL